MPARRFDSLSAFARHMDRLLITLPAAQRRGLDQAADLVLAEAKSIPGHAQPGWPPLKPATIAAKAAGNTPLRETGAMRGSYERSVASPTRAEIGSNDPKAVVHEYGNRHVPPRPVFLPTAMRTEGAVRAILASAVYRHLAGQPAVTRAQRSS